jgi:hypothetical protein
VAKETAEEERKTREAEKEAEKREILELRQATAALRKEKEAYEAMYGHSELGSLRDDDSVRSNFFASDVRWREDQKQVRYPQKRSGRKVPLPNRRTPG